MAATTEILADITPDDALKAARGAVRAAAAEIEAATKAAARGAVAGIRGAAGGAGAAALFNESAYMGWVTGEIEAISQELQPMLFDELRRQLRTGADPRAIANARKVATRQSRRISGNMVATELNKIGKVIASGIEGGQNPLAVARRLDAVKGLDAARAGRYEKMKGYLEGQNISDTEFEKRLESFYKKELRSRKETIARTEMRMSTSEAKIEKARSENAQFKAWSTAGDENVDPESCAANELQGWIPIKDDFQSGHDTTPAHPNCRCNVVTKTQAPTAADKARRETKAAQTEQARKRGENEAAKAKIEAKAAKKGAGKRLGEAKGDVTTLQKAVDDARANRKKIEDELGPLARRDRNAKAKIEGAEKLSRDEKSRLRELRKEVLKADTAVNRAEAKLVKGPKPQPKARPEAKAKAEPAPIRTQGPAPDPKTGPKTSVEARDQLKKLSGRQADLEFEHAVGDREVTKLRDRVNKEAAGGKKATQSSLEEFVDKLGKQEKLLNEQQRIVEESRKLMKLSPERRGKTAKWKSVEGDERKKGVDPSKSFKKTADKASEQLADMVDKQVMENWSKNRVAIELKPGERAWQDGNEIGLTKMHKPKVWLHEMGHAIELDNPDIQKRMNDFVKARTKGEKFVRMDKLFPDAGYGPGEKTKPDKFFSPYIGKTYEGASTEVLSMGLERMFDDPIGFSLADPGHFDLIWSILHGK